MKHIVSLKTIVIAVASLLLSGAANATIAVVYDDFDGGLINFNDIVGGAGGTATHDQWSTQLKNTVSNQDADGDGTADYSVSKNNGASLSPLGAPSAYYRLAGSSPTRYSSGYMVRIDPDPDDTAAPPYDSFEYKGSGATLTFTTGINAIGFEVGDWGTCCQSTTTPSNLYISFDNGTPILVGSSTTIGDAYLTNGGAGVFVAAFDDTGFFNTVQFWGDGFGEALYFGGTIHYARLDQGSLTDGVSSSVPEPASLVLLGLGLAGLSAMRRKQKAV